MQLHRNIDSAQNNTMITNQTLNPSDSDPTYFDVSLPDSQWDLEIFISSNYSMAVGASIGFEKLSLFKVNLASNDILTYTTDCDQCSDPPYEATDYFDIYNYNYETVDSKLYGPQGPYDGYAFYGKKLMSELCIDNENGNLTAYCSVENVETIAVTAITHDYWNFEVPALAGSIGLNWDSPIWTDVIYCEAD